MKRPPSVQKTSSPGEQMLLWGVVGALLLGGAGGALWISRQTGDSPGSRVQIASNRPDVPVLLAQAEHDMEAGRSGDVASAARVALSLDAEPDVALRAHRLLARSAEAEVRLPQALREWQWVKRNGGNAADAKSCERVRAALQGQAMKRLDEARAAWTAGRREAALQQAQDALAALENYGSDLVARRAGHLLVATYAWNLKSSPLALYSLRQARTLGPLTTEQASALRQLERQPQAVHSGRPAPFTARLATLPPSQPGGTRSPVRATVVRPREEETTAYPQRAGLARSGPSSLPRARVGFPPPQAEEAETASAPTNPSPGRNRPGQRFELPHLPGTQAQSGLGVGGAGRSDLPSYQDRNGSDTLPTYRTGRSGGSLPGY